MIRRIHLGPWLFTFTLAKTTKVIGANSQLGKDEHILMWDFDNKPLHLIEHELGVIQRHFELPEIKIFKTSSGKHYQAWCYKRLTWWESKKVVASTKWVDEGFFRFGVFRGHFTLRTSSKNNQKIKLVATLPSEVPADCNEFDLMSWTKYETLSS
jgi:hypothetical protein